MKRIAFPTFMKRIVFPTLAVLAAAIIVLGLMRSRLTARQSRPR